MKSRGIFLALLLTVVPGLAWSWWNDQWASRKQISLDGSVTGADLKEQLNEFPLLLRLHEGNFAYFAELAEGGKDLRFMVDDKTPVKYHIEKFDPVGGMALVWVKVPQFRGGIDTDSLWMYYGNSEAVDGSDVNGTYDVNHALVFHFDEANPVPRDSTAYGNNAAGSNATVDPAGWIGAAAKFAGTGPIQINASPSLQVDPAKGWSFSTWIKIDQPQQDGIVFHAGEGANALELLIKGQGLVGRAVNGAKTLETAPAQLQLGKWQHVALVRRPDKIEVYLDGNPVGSAAGPAVALNPTITLGGGAASGFLVGSLDEVHIANIARSAEWIKLLARSQSPDFTVANFGQDESKQGAGDINSFLVIIQNVTVDGWVVIGLTAVMFVVAVLVMITKGLVISRVRKDNKVFLEKYEALSADTDLGALDQEESEEDKEIADSDFLTALVGKHDHFQSSTLYKVYHAGIHEMKKRLGGNAKPMTPESLNAIRVKLDSVVVRESQRLNANMVLLTIAIAGGPFLGLLGTVVGVMITFAVIAATGDVNINSIAPGIAAALLATVAGLAVAIPALFGYNYLLTQIKDITADMRVFTDEFIAMLTEYVADRQRST